MDMMNGHQYGYLGMSLDSSFGVGRSKDILMMLVTTLAVIGIFFVPAIKQDPAYHLFVDHRHFVGVDNFFNVVSNLPFVTLGISGLFFTYFVKKHKLGRVGKSETTYLYTVFFAGILLTGFGSAYYHYNPTNKTLIWDRLPMTISFMAFFCMVIGYHASMILAKKLLAPLLVLGMSSVIYWAWTEGRGEGDLRPYVLVQFLLLILVPILISKSKAEFLQSKTIWLVIGYYAMAKGFEQWDALIYDKFLIISGHSIKHMVAALGAYVVYLHFKRDFRHDFILMKGRNF